MNRKKILFLGINDTPSIGNALFAYNSLPNSIEKRIVALYSPYHLAPSLIGGNLLVIKIVERLIQLYRWLYAFLRFGLNVRINNNERATYCYYQNEFLPDLSMPILRKIEGFRPDYIAVYWTSHFLASKTIRSLYQKTGATIVFSFVDQQHMTGGCHYPVECVGYKNECLNCPALVSGKKFSHYQLKEKIRNLKDVPIIIIGTPFDCRVAIQESSLFKGRKSFSRVRKPQVVFCEKSSARKYFSIDEDSFVVFFGCSGLYEKRKGAYYAIESVKKLSQKQKNVKLLFAGKYTENDVALFEGIDVIFAGFLKLDDMFKAFCASDCFLSTTIADSGPMMVNYAMALGIPVISFEIGIAESLVIHKKTGYMAKYKDIDDLCNGLEYIKSLSKDDRKLMSKTCISHIESMSKDGILYEHLL